MAVSVARGRKVEGVERKEGGVSSSRSPASSPPTSFYRPSKKRAEPLNIHELEKKRM